MRMLAAGVIQLGLVFGAYASLNAAEPDLILHNGKVVTVDAKFSLVQAIAVTGNRISAVGSDDEILALKGERTQLVDLAGKLAMPGLIDSHVHAQAAAMHEFDHPIPDMQSIADVLAYVKSRADTVPQGEWISVSQIFITRLREQRFPTKAELDEAAPQHPVVFATGPDAMLNSRALKESGIDKDFRVVGAGFVEKDPATGEPTGMLRACERYIKSRPTGKSATTEEKLDRLATLLADYNSVGITGIADRAAGADEVERYLLLRDAGRLTVRTAISWHIDTGGEIDEVRKEIASVAANPLVRGDARLRIVGIKTFLDGGMLTGSAYMREPWGVSTIYGIRDPQYRGVLMVPREKLTPIVRATVEAGLQFTAHSVGDGAIETLLDAYDEVNLTLPIRATRPCLTHANFMSRETIARMARLGIVADMQPAWLYLDARTLSAQFGDVRLRWFQPLKSLFEAGVTVGGGSDHMQKIGSLRAINPYDPFLAIWVALTRRARWFDGQLHAEEALTREQAIRFYTANNAFITFQEEHVGSLEPGKLADIVVIDRDILECPIDDVRETQVLRTYFDGKLVFERK